MKINKIMNKNRERTFLEIIKRFLEPIRLRKLIYFKYTIVSVTRWLNGIVHVLFLERITFYLQSSDKVWFNNILKYYIIFIVIYEIINFSIRKWWWVETIPLWMGDIYKKYLNKYIILDNNKIETIWTWKLIWIINSWVEKWLELLADFFEQWVALLITFVFTLYMIFKVDYWYSVIFLWLAILFLVISSFFNSKLIPYRKQRYEYRNSRLKDIVKVLMNKQEIMQSNKIDNETKIILNYSKKLREVNRNMWTYRTFMFRTSQLGMTLILLVSFWFLWNEVLVWNMELNVIVWLSWVLIIMQKSIAEAVSFYVRITKDFIDIEKLWDFFDETETMKWYNSWKDFEYKKWEIELKNVNYWYIKNKPVFENLNLKLKWWKVTAFVWNSWSWKSTLVKLIAGYIRANSGEIIIDGQKINDIKLKTYYKNIGYLTQDPSVFDGSILDNLMYWIQKGWTNNNSPIIPFPLGTPWGYKGDENNSKDVWQKHLELVIKQSKCEFIYDLEKGLDTEIWERGVRLSWGQKQRLAIAKIMLKDPKIIILDEPTSALDSFSEEQITYAMHNLFENRTVIIIAHRLQTVKEASDIILFENWKIKERWTHKELVELKWDYNKMLELQSGF